LRQLVQGLRATATARGQGRAGGRNGPLSARVRQLFRGPGGQQQLYPAQNTLAQIRRGRLLAHVQLYKSLGGGWSLTDAEWKDEAKGKGG